MGYYMRYIVTDGQDISLSLIEAGLKQVSPDYSVADGELLMYDGSLYGRFEINRPGDGLFDEEIEELKEAVEENPGEEQSRVLQTLCQATAIVALQVLWQERETEETFARIDPLWEWLFSNRQGLLQAEGEGYYFQSHLVLAVD